jgi:glycosyltransferase involved in cell wall biosynthesis
MSQRPSVLFVVWSSRAGRASEISAALGGEFVAIYPGAFASRRLTPLRYLVSVLQTLAMLIRRRPRAVIVTHPPVFAAATVGLWAIATKTPFVIDSHPTAFGAKGNRLSAATLGLHAWLARRSKGVLVACDHWAEIVRQWQATGVVVHEAPSDWRLVEPSTPSETPTILYVGVLGSDEPIEEVLDAAARSPQFRWQITGDSAKLSPEVLAKAPSNVSFTGFLSGCAYRDAVEGADLVLALTTEPASVMRAGCEAVYAGKVLVASDTPATAEAFPDAVRVANTADSIATGVSQAVSELAELQSKAPAARERQLEMWNNQVHTLQSLLS